MWATSSKPRDLWLELLWAIFCALAVYTMVLVPRAETVPFHFIWVSFTLLYGYRMWPWSATVLVLVVISVVTGIALLGPVLDGQVNPQELTEVPLMGAMFLAMAWHARRHQAAVEDVRRMAASQQETLDREHEFVRDASHELKTPITVARGHLELVLARVEDPEVAEDTAVALAELDRLAQIADRLLMLARVERPGELRNEELDLSELLGVAARRWSQVCPRRWLVEVGQESSVRGDADRLEAAIDALVENAVQATHEGGLIQLRSRDVPGGTVIDVVDDGVGIPAGSLNRVFDRFWRLPLGTQTQRSGSGLGLSIVKAIAEAHGGSVAVHSEQGRGSTFSILLPTPAQLALPAGAGPPEHERLMTTA